MNLTELLIDSVPVILGGLIAGLAGAVVAMVDARKARERQREDRAAQAAAERTRERRRLDEDAAEAAAIALMALRFTSPHQLEHITPAHGDEYVEQSWRAVEDARTALARVMVRHYDDDVVALAEETFGDVTNAGNASRVQARNLADGELVIDLRPAEEADAKASETLDRFAGAVRERLGRSLYLEDPA